MLKVSKGMEELSYKLKNRQVRQDRRERPTALNVMLFISGMLTGIVVLVVYEVISEGIGSSRKLHDRYHE